MTSQATLALTALITLAAPRLPAQASADTAAIVQQIANVIADDAHKSADHHPPFVMTPDSNPRWTQLLETELAAHHVGILVPTLRATNRPSPVRLSVGRVTLSGDSASAIITWSRCGAVVRPGMNFWQHEITFHFVRAAKGWRALPAGPVLYGEGRC
jgi:hypothetical protein